MEQIRYGRKKNGIIKHLNEKLNSWVDSIDDENVRKAVKKNTIVTGGSIASMLLGEQINDYDVYFRDKHTTKLVAEYYVKKYSGKNDIVVKEEIIKNIKGENEDRVLIWIRSEGIFANPSQQYDYFESTGDDTAEEYSESLNQAETETSEPYRVVFLSQNAITLSNKMQIVIRFYGEPDKIHSNYDFVHAMNYYDWGKNELALKVEAMEALLSRTLYYTGSLYPIASIWRTKKFINRGWRISAGQLLKIMWQISEINLKDRDVIREQLIGVDAAYLYQLIRALESVDMDLVDSTYVGTIIDRIFNE